MSYKLSYTAQEVDELLGKVKGGVCLPVVDLTGLNLTTTIGEISPIEDEAVITVLNQNIESPGLIVRTKIDNDGEIIEFCVHLNRIKEGKIVCFFGTVLICDIMLLGDDTGWIYRLVEI